MGYYHRRQRESSGAPARVELIATVAVVVVLLAAFIVFLFVYHDVPLRIL